MNRRNFVNNILMANQGFKRNPLKVEQAKPLCGKLKHPQLSKLNGNVYIKRNKNSKTPLIYWSLVNSENCTANYYTFSEFQNENIAFEKNRICHK